MVNVSQAIRLEHLQYCIIQSLEVTPKEAIYQGARVFPGSKAHFVQPCSFSMEILNIIEILHLQSIWNGLSDYVNYRGE